MAAKRLDTRDGRSLLSAINKGGRTMSKRLVIVTALMMAVLVSLFIVGVAQGQEIIPKAWKGEFRGYFMIGWSPINIDDFNDRLEAKGYSKHSDDFLSLGGGAHVIVKRIVLGGEGHALLVGNEEAIIPAGSFKTSLSGIYGFLNVGYLVHRQGGLDIYPLIGLGGGSMNLKIGNAEFDEVLDNPRGNARLFSGGPEVGITGPYLRLMIGGGVIGRK